MRSSRSKISEKTTIKNVIKQFTKMRLVLIAFFVFIALASSAVFSATAAGGSLNNLLFGSASLFNFLGSGSAAVQPNNSAQPKAVLSYETVSSNAARSGHTATDLGGGKVLLVGGDAGGTSSIFDVGNGTFAASGSLSVPRANHTATKLSDGRVLIAGGDSGNGAGLNSTEIYDPAAGSFTAGPNLTTGRTGQTATLLPDGAILIVGGDIAGSAEILNLNQGSTPVAALLNTARSAHSAALMKDGRVLIVGGRDADGNKLDSAEIFDGTSFSAAGNVMKHYRVRPFLRVLHDGKVQIIGGNNDDSMEVYDPNIDTIGAHGHLIPTNDEHDALLRNDILIAPTRAALFHNGQEDSLLDRENHTITETGNKALVAGGKNSNGDVLSSSSLLNSSGATVSSDKLDYAPGQTAVISGTGWQAGETVNIILHEDPHTHTERRLTATADDNGNFQADYLVEPHDLNVTFIIGAKGASSGRTAQTTFTDAAKTWTGAVSTSWNTAGNWSPSGVPTSADTVTIPSAPANQPILNTTAGNCLSITVDSGATLTIGTADLTIANGGSVTINGSVSFSNATNVITGGGNGSNGVSVVVNSGASLTTANAAGFSTSNNSGSISINAGNKGAPNYSAGANYAYNGSVAQVTGNALTGAATLTINNSAGVTLTSPLSAVTTLTVGNITANSILNDNGNQITSTGTLNLTSGTLKLGSAGAGTSFPVFSTVNILSGTTVEYASGAAQTVAAVNYGNVTSSGAGGRTLASSGTIGIAGAFTPGTNIYTVTGSTVNFNGAGAQTVPAFSFNNLTISGARTSNSVSLASGTINVAGNLSASATFTSGGYIVTGNTVILNGGAQTISGTPTFNNLTINASGNKDFGTSTNTVNGNLSVAPGTMAAGTSSFIFNGSGNLAGANDKNFYNIQINSGVTTTISSGDVTVANNFVNNGTYTYSGAIKKTTFSGAASQQISGSGTTTFGDLTINKSGGNITLAQNISVDSALTLTSGIIDGATNNKSVTIGASGTATTGSGSSHVSGKLARVYSSTGSKNFPIGKGGNFRPVTLNYTTLSGTSTVTAEQFESGFPGAAPSGTAQLGTRYWNVTQTGGSSFAYNITLDGTGTTPTGTVKILKHDGGTTNVLAAGAPNYTATGLTSLSDFALAEETCTAPTVSTQPTDSTITYGQNAAFSAAAGGTPSPTLQWEFSTNGGGSWNNVPGATSSPLTVITPAVSQSGTKYRAVFSNGCGGSVASNAATLTVNQKTVTGSFTANNKIYDGNTNATISTRTITPADIVGSDVVTLTGGTASFDNKNVGTGKTVSGTGFTLGGANAGNYTLGTVATTTANITAKNLTINGAGANNKVYDRTTAATVNFGGASLVGVVSPDVVTIDSTGYAANFNNFNVGTAKPVTVTGVVLSGAGASNYTVSQPSGLSADITAKNLTISGAVANNKVYDGGTAATVSFSGASLVGIVSPDAVSIDSSAYTANFGSKSVGTGKAVTVSGVGLTGANAGNYTVSQLSGLTADITPKNLTVNGAVANNKVYDGNSTATVDFSSATLSGVITPDVVTINSGYSASFGDKNVGNGKAVTVTGVTLAGADKDNYTVSQPVGLTANITPATVTGSFTANNKTYDGTTAATIATRSITGGIVGSEDVTLTGGTATFNTKDAGTGKTVTGTGFALGGADAGNYVLGTVATASADITPKALTVTATGVDKVYDGTTAATVTLSDDRISGDVFTASYTSANFADKHVGSGKAISVSGISISGTDAGNYSANATANASANITPRTLNVTATGINKVYDGTTAATVNLNGDGIGGDIVSLSYTAAFADKNVGTGKPVSVTAIAIDGGTDGGNYMLGNTTTSTTADITPKSVTASVTAADKTYNGNANAIITNCTLAGVINPDTTGCAASSTASDNQFDNANAGLNKTVTANNISLTNNTDGNYTLSSATAFTTANINKAAVTATAGGGSATYDGMAKSPSACQVTGAYTGDLTCANDPVSVGPGAGTTTIVPVVSGTGLSNFDVNPVNGSFTINKASLTVTADNKNKSYDGMAFTAFTSMITGFVNNENSSVVSGSPGYSGDAVGAVNAGSYTITPTLGTLSAANYDFVSFVNGTLNISKAAVTATAGSGSSVFDGSAKSPSTCIVSGDYKGDLTCANDPASVGPGAGTTPINPVVSGTGLGNFEITSVPGSYTIEKAGSTTTVSCPAAVTYNGSAQTPCTVSVTGDGGLNLTPNPDYSNNVNFGTATASYTFAGDDNHTGSSDSKNFTINKAAVTATAGGGTATYDGMAKSPSACQVTGTYTGDLTCANDPVSVGPGAGTTTIAPVVSGTGLSNFDITLVTGTATITKADSATSILCPANITYTGSAQTPCTVSVTGAGGLNLTPNPNYTNNVNAGTATASYTFAGGDNHNGSSDSKNFTIDPALLTAAVGANNKPYDGNASATINGCSFTGVVNGDDVSCATSGYTASFNNKNVGTNKTVTAAGLTKTGANAGNYSFNGAGTGLADITAIPLTASVNASNKTYDGNASATVNSCSFTGVLTNDVVNCVTNGYTASFDNKNVGTGKPVSAGGLGKSGTDAGNYSFNGNGTGSANITKKDATWTTNPNSKYFGQADPNPLTTGSGSGFISADGVTATYSRAAGSNAGPYQITATLTATVPSDLNNYNITNNGAIFTINPDPTALSLDSDMNGYNFDCINNTYKATLKDTITNQGVSGVTLKMTIGSQSATAVTNGSGEATFTLILSQNPGSVTQKVEVDPSFTWNDTNRIAPTAVQRSTFTILANPNVGPGRDADSLYSGSLWFWTTGSSSSTATLTLSATIMNTGECNGDITKAKASFLISTNGGTSFSPVSNAQNLPVGLVNPNDPNTGTASAISQYNIGSSQSVTLVVRVVVGGQYNYSGATFDVPISIGKPGQANSLMGGGKLKNDGSPFPANGYLGANSIKSEFGTQVTYNKSGTNPKGDVTVTITTCNKPDGTVVDGCTKYTSSKWRTYFIKSNAISELSLISGSASFGSKTNVSEVLADGSKVGLDGGNTMQLLFTPYQKPFPPGAAASGTTCMNQSGCASIVIYKSTGGVWYSSAWGQVGTSAPKTYLKNVVGGDVTVQ